MSYLIQVLGFAIAAVCIILLAYQVGYRDGRRYGQQESTHPGETTRPRPNR